MQGHNDDLNNNLHFGSIELFCSSNFVSDSDLTYFKKLFIIYCLFIIYAIIYA